MRLLVVGFEREAHQQTSALACAQLGGDVLRAAQAERQASVALLHLALRDLLGRVVRHGGAHHGAVRRVEGLRGRAVHLFGRQHLDAAHALRCGERRAAAHERDVGTPCRQFARNGIAHLARRMVGEVAHGVDGFDRGSGSHQVAFPGERRAPFARGQQPLHGPHDGLGLLHAAFAREAAGQLALARLDHRDAPFGQRAQVLLRGDVGVHVQIHGRSHGHRTAGREVGREQEVVRRAVGHFRQRVGRRGGYEHQVGPLAQRDVGVPGAVLGIEEFDQDGTLRERGHGQRRDELLGQRRHHHLHLGACGAEQTTEHRGLIGGDASRDSQQYVFALQHRVLRLRLSSPPWARCRRGRRARGRGTPPWR